MRLDESPEFVDVNPRYLLALDAAGRVIGHNRAAQRLLEAEARAVECHVGGHACKAAALVCARAGQAEIVVDDGDPRLWPTQRRSALRQRVLAQRGLAVVLANRRARRAKTDRLDCDKLLALLLRHHAGERHASSTSNARVADRDFSADRSVSAAGSAPR